MEGVAPYTDKAVVSERYRFDDESQLLVVERSLTDPEYYDGPVTWVTRYRPADYPDLPL